MAEKRGAITRLIDYFSDLPSIGRKSAERLAYHVLRMPQAEALAFADAIRAVKENLRPCTTCFNLTEEERCEICTDPRRDQGLLCVVEQVRDLFALEQVRGVHQVGVARDADLVPGGAQRPGQRHRAMVEVDRQRVVRGHPAAATHRQRPAGSRA